MSTATLFLKERMRVRVRASLARRHVKTTARKTPTTQRLGVVVVLDPYNLKRLRGNELLGFEKAVLVASKRRGFKFFKTTYGDLKSQGIDLLGIVDPEEKDWGKLLGYLVGNQNGNGI